MSFLSQFILSEPLMRWREPNAYSRHDIAQRGRLILFGVVLMIPSLLIMMSPETKQVRMILASLFGAIGVAVFIRVWFGPGDVVCLQQDHISKASNRPALRTRYTDIESCSVSHDSYHDAKFPILSFTLKEGLPSSQVRQIVFPDDSTLERALQIIRDRGVKILETT